MPGDRDAGSENRRHPSFVGPMLLVFAVIFLAYAGYLLWDGAGDPSIEDGPLSVRTDLMRGQPCHVEEGAIMGDCTPEQIRMLQREAELRLVR